MKRNFFAGSLPVRMASCHPAKLAARNKGRIVLVSLVVSFFGVAYQIRVHAQAQCNAAYAWSPATTSTNTSGPASAPVNDTAFNPLGHSYSYFAQGTEVYAVRNVADADGPAGSIKWTFRNGSAIFNTPTPVTLSNGKEVVFVTGTDGFLYKINAADPITGLVSVDTRRVASGLVVCVTDELKAPAAVQLYNLSNSTFKASMDAVPGHSGDDLVFVITHYIATGGGTCPDGQNRVLALFASDLSIRWTFNSSSFNLVGAGDGGCALDYGTNTLFCGTEKVETANTLWAFNTLTSLTTVLARWATDTVASIQFRPTLAVTAFGTRLYVGTADGFIKSYDASTGKFLWETSIAPSAMAHTSAMFNDTLLVVDSGGSLRAIQDVGSAGTQLWTTVPSTTGVVFSSAPVVVVSLNKGYVGRSDGTIQEIDLTTGAPGEVVVVNTGAAVFDPSLDIEGGAPDFNRLVVVGGSVVTRLIIPFCSGQATPTITWPAPTAITYGTALSATQLDATANVPGNFVYSPAAGSVPGAGSQTLSVSFTPTDTTNFTGANASVALTVNQATPTITWPPPPAITYGTALSAAQLDATANVPGNFVYSPASGSVLGAGSQTLSVSFTPTDTTNYTTANATVALKVNPARLTITVTSLTNILKAPLPAFSASDSGFVNGDTAASLGGTLNYTTTATTSSPVGSYPITTSGQTSTNYAIAYVPGTLKILYAPIGTMCDGDGGHMILQPINADGTSVFKQGRTVPVKFRVCDANGISVGTPGVVSGFMLAGMLSGTTTLNVEDFVDTNNPDMAFRWDPLSQLWIINIATSNLTAGTTYIYTITLNDGTMINFQYGLR